MTLRPDEFHPLIGALLRRPWEVVRDRMLAGLHSRGFDDLSAAHLNVLQYPGPHETRPSDLAARTRMTRQALNYLLAQMETLGYLERPGARSAPRSRQIYLTARGHAAMAAVREVVTEVEREWEARLGRADFARLRELLIALNALAVEDTSDRPTGNLS